MKLLITLVLFSLYSFSASADPIQDSTFKNYNAAWIKSVATPCSTICKKVVANAEHEGFWIPGNNYGKTTFDCKSLTNVALSHGSNFKAKGTLYGTNFSHSRGLKRLCLVPTHTGQVQKLKNFMCLCIRKKLTLNPHIPRLVQPTLVNPLLD